MSLGVYNGAGSGVTRLLLHMEGNANDSSGNSNNGTSTNITYSQANGRFGMGAGFNGSSSVVTIAHSTSLVLSNNFTIALWFKPANLTQTNTYILGKGNQYTIIWEYVNNTIEFYTDPETIVRAGSQMVLSDTNWHHIGYTFNGTNLNGYVDGVQKISVNNSGKSLGTTNQSLTLGAASVGTAFCACSLDEVIIENRAWSASEVKKYYTNSRGFYATL